MRLGMLLPLVVFFAPAGALAEEYLVGSPAYPTLESVPFETLDPGDVVAIPYRAEPYRVLVGLSRSGTAEAPIVVRGVKGPNGERPILDGIDAVARSGAHPRSLLSLRGGAEHIVIEGLELRHAHSAHAQGGTFPTHASSGIYLERCAHVLVRDNVIHGNGNGLFSAPGTADVRVEGNLIYGNGVVDRILEHNIYTESDGIVFEGNFLGPLCDGCRGNNLKDRSVDTVVRYNFIVGGNRALDLVEADHADPDFVARLVDSVTHVYGNVLVKLEETTQSQIVHFGGDGGGTANYRRHLRFYHNTLVSTRAGRTTFFHFDADAPSIELRNLILHASSDENLLLDSSTSLGASISLEHAYLPEDWRVSVNASLASTLNTAELELGDDPGFVDAAARDFRLVSGAAVRDRGAALGAGFLPVARQYVDEASTEPRPSSPPPDLGAFEFCDGTCAAVVPLPGGEGEPGSDGGTAADGAGSSGCGCDAGGAGELPLAGLVLALWGFGWSRRRGAQCPSRSQAS